MKKMNKQMRQLYFSISEVVQVCVMCNENSENRKMNVYSNYIQEDKNEGRGFIAIGISFLFSASLIISRTNFIK